MKQLFEAITKVTESIEGLSVSDKHRVLNFVQSGVHHEVPEGLKSVLGQAVPKEEAPKKAPAPKKKRSPAKKKEEPVVVPTLEEMMELCRDTANRLKSADKVKELIKLSCGVEAIKVADPATFIDLKKKLTDAK